MSIFIDSGAFIAYYNLHDEFHGIAQELFKEIENNSFGQAITSDYMLNEATARVLTQIGKEKAIELGKSILDDYPVVHVNEHVLEKAWERFKKIKPFSLADCTSLVIIENDKIDCIFTFDSHFKNFVKTVGAR